MTKVDLELQNAQQVTELGHKIKNLDHNVLAASQQYVEYREQILDRVTPEMRLFDTLFNAITYELLYKNTTKAIVDFNKKWGSKWRKLNRMSKSWSDLCSIYYTAAIRGDLKEAHLFQEGKALKEFLEKRSKTDTTSYHLLLAYLAWIDCQADPTYRFPYDD
ncbi:hypothetical protein HF82_04745 [Limosilactobacillus reuteri]|nr:hypothetical protein [Limosilactobacillus reuteri]KEQ20111.1 hypothetical protein HF82_04745 [Limosilactobacillus reuteri]